MLSETMMPPPRRRGKIAAAAWAGFGVGIGLGLVVCYGLMAVCDRFPISVQRDFQVWKAREWLFQR